jgi:hypothetical protein
MERPGIENDVIDKNAMNETTTKKSKEKRMIKKTKQRTMVKAESPEMKTDSCRTNPPNVHQKPEITKQRTRSHRTTSSSKKVHNQKRKQKPVSATIDGSFHKRDDGNFTKTVKKPSQKQREHQKLRTMPNSTAITDTAPIYQSKETPTYVVQKRSTPQDQHSKADEEDSLFSEASPVRPGVVAVPGVEATFIAPNCLTCDQESREAAGIDQAAATHNGASTELTLNDNRYDVEDGIIPLEAHVVNNSMMQGEEAEQRLEAEMQRIQKELQRIKKERKQIQKERKAQAVVDAVPVKPWWKCGCSRYRLVVLVGVVIVIALAITLGVTLMPDKEKTTSSLSPQCQAKCQGLLTGIPFEGNWLDFQQAILEYLRDPSSSPYGSVINCWDVSKVSTVKDVRKYCERSMIHHPDLSSSPYDSVINCWDVSKVSTVKDVRNDFCSLQ